MKKGKIVIVDDELSMVEFLSNMLIQDGYQVESTTDGKQAIDLVRANSPDIVISDIKMSPLNGLQILKQVKQINPEINVIMITAFGSIEGAVGAVKDGAYDYITKPFKIENIRSVIKRALSTRRLITRDESIQAELKEKYGFSNI
ncbi:MAG: sigma-54-dependent Fis family transcriptional regulator, partial [Candidatus Omnitrophica bacterium]|nr:sigma-54-dependent Fis family transcriptional regulator [Candidatus Omnitrophota bacterium]